MIRGQISIEGDGPDLIAVLQQAREIAPKLSEIRLITSPGKLIEADSGAVDRDAKARAEIINPPKGGVPTLREFVKRVSPANLAERIIAIGVYQSRHHAQDSFSPKEMADWFTHAGLQKPSQMPVALFSAKQRYGYLESPGHGRWKVTTAGENAVTRKLEENGGLP